MTKRDRGTGVHLCLDHSIARMVDQHTQMHRKEGPFWDAWVKAGGDEAARQLKSKQGRHYDHWLAGVAMSRERQDQ